MKKLFILFCLLLLLVACGKKETTDGQIAYIPASTASAELPGFVTAAPAATAAPLFTAVPPSPTAASTPAPTPTPVPTPEPTPTPVPLEAQLGRYVAGMTDREKIGQLVMFGFSGTKAVSAEFGKIMADYAVGNVILYGPNISRGDKDGGFDRCARLTEDIRAHNATGIPLLISTDVEGGNVTRFRWRTRTQSADALGTNGDEEAARLQFERIATALNDVGINTDLAPVLDVAKSPSKTFLGKRIISSDEATAARIGVACVDGLQTGGCLSIVKHFPGHGATTADSHNTTPVVKKTLEELEAYELYPFRQAVAAGVDGIMVAHILYPAIDPDHIATQSEVIITDLLRTGMGFEGVVMSDDFRMNGLRSKASLEQAAVQFILAGGDLILCGANHSYQRSILKGLTDAVANGTISQERLNESVVRLLTAKMKVTAWEPEP